jgi:lipoprotein-releasing system ATP-binding protein
MSDPLEQLLSEVPVQFLPPAAQPRPGVGARVRGGIPLDAGPRLDVHPPAAVPRRREPEHATLPAAHLDILPHPSKPRPAPAEVQLVALNLEKSYRKAAIEVPVLRGLSMEVCRGEFLSIVGQSGSGKSTLLHLLGTLDAPDQGEIHFDGRRIDNLPSRGRDALRNRHFGMIFQFYHLLPELNTLENVLAPLMITFGTWAYLSRRRQHRAAALELLEMVGLTHRLKHRPRELSGGEMQRAAIARALVTRPSLLLADEPTGNLDRDTGQEIIRILRTLNQRQNLTIVMVTHDHAIAAQTDRIVRLADGRIAGE